MNGYAVQDAWIKHAQRDRIAEGAAVREKARAVLRQHLPALRDDPYAVMALVELWDRNGDGNVTPRMVRDYLRAYHEGRHARGWVSAEDLGELLKSLEAA